MSINAAILCSRSNESASGYSFKFTRARIFKCLWSPGIDFKASLPPAYVAWRAGTITLFLLGAYSPHRFLKNSGPIIKSDNCCLFHVTPIIKKVAPTPVGCHYRTRTSPCKFPVSILVSPFSLFSRLLSLYSPSSPPPSSTLRLLLSFPLFRFSSSV
jgi:hypothetical protein